MLITRFICLCFSLPIISNCLAGQEVVNVYSFRQAELINPLIEKFHAKTGIRVNIVSGKADKLMQRLIKDGKNSFADVLLTVDVARLDKAKELDLIKPIYSLALMENIPAHLRDPENFWFGLSLRARAIFYDKQSIKATEILNYKTLLAPKWQGKICSRKGSHLYNRSMIASFIFHYGQNWTKDWVGKFSNNLAMRPNGGDRDQLRNIARGECKIAIANSYYYGMLFASDKQSDRNVYQRVGIVLPKTKKIGTHVNISGAALTSAAKNKVNAIKFIEFLTTKAAQKIYANNNFEYPIRPDMPIGSLLSSWGNLTADTQAVHQLPNFHQQAEEIILQSNW